MQYMPIILSTIFPENATVHLVLFLHFISFILVLQTKIFQQFSFI